MFVGPDTIILVYYIIVKLWQNKLNYVFVCSKPVCTDESPDDLGKMTLEQINYVFVGSKVLKPVCTHESPDDLGKMTSLQIKLCFCSSGYNYLSYGKIN